MEQVELVSVETSDGVRLDGTFSRAHEEPTLGIDLVIFHHGRGTNFYNPSMAAALTESFLNSGCSVLRVNNRGHDHAYQTRKGWLGSAYEIVDDFRRDSAAWLDFGESAGFGRNLVWGHSLGAVKLLYLLAIEPDDRIVRAIASSPPRFHYATFVEGPEAAGRVAAFESAKSLVAAGRPEALVEFDFGTTQWFSAGSLLDKYGPDDRYDYYRHLPSIELPLLVTLGGLEDGMGFAPLGADGPGLADKQDNLTYASVEGADHSYLARVPEVWTLAREWLLG
ncbi:MAG TPA: alpha/beta fold hydrolase [Acidimicrobiales bacterium]